MNVYVIYRYSLRVHFNHVAIIKLHPPKHYTVFNTGFLKYINNYVKVKHFIDKIHFCIKLQFCLNICRSNIISKCLNVFSVLLIYAILNIQIFKTVLFSNQYIHTDLQSKYGRMTLQRFLSLMLRSCKIISYTICKFDSAVAILHTNVIMVYVTSHSHRPFQVHLVHFNHAYYIFLLKNFTIKLYYDTCSYLVVVFYFCAEPNKAK